MDRLRDAKSTLPDRMVFGRFELQPFERRLLVDGGEATLGGRAFDVLLILAERVGSLVSRNELIDRVWPGLVVEENNLNVQVHALRRVLGSDVVVTVPGRGYRLVASVQAVAPLDAPLHASRHESVRESLPESSTPRTHLPQAGTPLVGRDTELAALAALMKQHRLVTVTGAGGIGKTRLAQTLLHRGTGTFRHGVCWVDLAPVRDAAALPGVIGAALDLQAPAGESIAALARTTAGLEMLIALDNAEHLVDGVAQVVQSLLDAASRLRFVVTSQVPLRLASEQVFRLGSLSLPDDDTTPPSQAMTFGAVALFAERARAADSRFVLTEAQMPVVVDLCRRLDGLPLAIELAAARAPALGLEPLRDALSGRLQLLTTNRNRHAPTRQQTLRAALEWSHGLLDEPARRVFFRLAVVAGSASLTFVQNIARDEHAQDGLDDWGVLDALDQLVQRALVEAVGDEPGCALLEPRYRLLESPRALAQERMEASGEEQALRRLHASAVLAEFERAEQAVRNGARGIDDWVRDGERDRADLRQAIDWATTVGHAALIVALVTALLERLPLALESEKQYLAQRCEDLLEGSPGIEPVVAQRGWLAVSFTVAAARRQVSCEAALRAVGLARRLHASGADAYELYRALCIAVRGAAWTKQLAKANAMLQEALDLEDSRWPAACRCNGAIAAAFIAGEEGQAAAALSRWRRVLDLGRQAGYLGLRVRVNIADMELLAGDAVAAAKTGRELVAALMGLRDESLLAAARTNLAAAYLACGDLCHAREQLLVVWPQSLQMARDAPYFHASFVDYAALLTALEGRHEDAAQLAGVADRCHASSDLRERNEAAACDRTCALVLDALGATAFEALRAQGRARPDLDIAELAFGGSAQAQVRQPRLAELHVKADQ